MRYFVGMFDDPEFYEEEPQCSCNRAIPKEEMVLYEIPRALPDGGFIVEQMRFDKACPFHGYTVETISANEAESD